MSNELKACPFCKAEMKLDHELTHWGDAAIHPVNGCDVFPFAFDVKAWNTRPIEDALSAELATVTAENSRLKDEAERTRNIMGAEIEKLQSALENRLVENLRTHTILKDWVEQHNKIINNQCPPDEKHCTCVPSLYAEISRLCAALAPYADENNWQDCQSDSGAVTHEWMGDGSGYDIAREALAKKDTTHE